MVIIINGKVFDTDSAEVLYKNEMDGVEFFKTDKGNIVKHMWTSNDNVYKHDKWHISDTGEMIEFFKAGKLNDPTQMYRTLKSLGVAGEIEHL